MRRASRFSPSGEAVLTPDDHRGPALYAVGHPASRRLRSATLRDPPAPGSMQAPVGSCRRQPNEPRTPSPSSIPSASSRPWVHLDRAQHRALGALNGEGHGRSAHGSMSNIATILAVAGVPERDRERDASVLHPERRLDPLARPTRTPCPGRLGRCSTPIRPRRCSPVVVRDAHVERCASGSPSTATVEDASGPEALPWTAVVRCSSSAEPARRGAVTNRLHLLIVAQRARRASRLLSSPRAAGVAQSAERLHGKEEVRGSIPLSGSATLRARVSSKGCRGRRVAG